MYKFLGIFLAGWLLLFSSCSSDEGGKEVVDALKKGNAKDFSFSLLSVNAKEVSVEKIKSILKKPDGWTIKSLKIDDSSFAEVTGTSVKDFKIKIKKAGEFSFSITLQKTGYEDFVLKGVKIKVTFLADAKDFDFPLLPVNAKEVSFAVLRGNVTSPAGWTIKSIAVADSSFGAVTGTGDSQKITIKKDGTFAINITLQKTGFVDYVLKGKIKASTPTQPLKKADAKDFNFPLLPVNVKEVSFAVLRGNVRSPAGWTIKSIAVADSAFGTVTGAGSNQKITIKKDGEFAINITLGKTGWEDFVLQGKIKASTPTQPPKKADPSNFSFPELPVNANEIPIATIESNIKKPTGWTIKSIAVVNSDFGAVTGAGNNQKIVLKKGGTFAINITLQKAGWVDFVLKGNIKAAKFTATASGFSFPELPVNANEILIATIQSNLKKPTGWTIKSLTVDDSSFGYVTGTGSSQKIVLKKGGGTFGITITLQKTGWVDFVLKGNIKAANLKADAKDFSFPLLSVNAKEIPIDDIKRRVKKPAGWTIKTIAVADATFGTVTGTGSSQKIVLKKGGTFAINITLQKTGWIDFVLKRNIKAANLTADAKDFSFLLLSVNAKEIPIATIQSNLKKPTGWTIKSLTVDDSSVAEKENQKIKIKPPTTFASRTFTISITLEKTGWVDHTLKGSIKADHSVFFLMFDRATQKITGVTDKTITTINIPDEIDGVAVTGIKKFSFRHNTVLTSVTIPNSVTVIGVAAFQGCTALISVTLPGSLTTIESLAFYGCTSLTSVTIPDSVAVIESAVFENCNKLVVTIQQKDPSKTKGDEGKNLSTTVFEKVKQIKVPQASLAAYKAAGGWSTFSGIMTGY